VTDSAAQYSIVIGLEVHVQLQTKSKLFCGCANLFNPDNPNVQTCPVCLGLPGALPVMNREAFRKAIKVGLALHCNFPLYEMGSQTVLLSRLAEGVSDQPIRLPRE
jgi:aspartyl-tRNA(Asn)/glutamyl-tRNA(Gln) amidotransferase subunit B